MWKGSPFCGSVWRPRILETRELTAKGRQGFVKDAKNVLPTRARPFDKLRTGARRKRSLTAQTARFAKYAKNISWEVWTGG